jgi:hypothetical protein
VACVFKTARRYVAGMDHVHAAACVYLRTGVLLVASHSYLACGTGGSVANGWVATRSAEMADDELGRTVRAAWAASECNAPMPDFSRPFPALQKILGAAEVRSQRQFVKGNLLLHVELNRDTVVLLPSCNEGAGNFSDLPELAEEFAATVEHAVLGRRVKEAIGHSR